MIDPARLLVDPDDPRAPPQDVWDRLTTEERRRLVAALPSDVPGTMVPEGDRHRIPKRAAIEALEEYYRRIRRPIYLSAELPVYYPGERMFAPDLIAVLDVEPHERASWIVSKEGRGLDLALEIHVAGSYEKDFVENVERFAALGVPEYFAFDASRGRLAGWKLPQARGGGYEPLMPQGGRWYSGVLDLDLAVEHGRLRFFHGSAPLLDAHELIEQLSTMVDEAIRRTQEESQRAEKFAARLRELGVDPDDIS